MIQSTEHESGGAVIGRVVLDRPEKKNALTPEMTRRFLQAVEAHGAGGRVGAVVVEGNGAAFCSGFDLALCAQDSSVLASLLVELAGAIRAMRACPVPVVVAAHGAAVAGGCALLGGADVAVTHTDAKLGYPVVKLGISPAVSAPYFAAGVGHGRARERMLDPSFMSGWEALRWGLVHECLEDAGKVRDRATAIALELAMKPVGGIRATKRLMNELAAESVDAWAERARSASLGLVGSEEERARLEALWKR